MDVESGVMGVPERRPEFVHLRAFSNSTASQD
jgi:hypothetical protein